MELKRFADYYLERRALLLIVCLALSAITLLGLTRLGFDDSPREVLRSSDDAFALLEEVFAQFGTDEANCFFVLESESLFSGPMVDRLKQIKAKAGSIEGIESTSAIDDILVFDSVITPIPRPLIPSRNAPQARFEKARMDAIQHPLVARQILSVDAQATLITARLSGDNHSIAEIKPVVDRLWEIADRYSDDNMNVSVTGIPPIRYDTFELVRTESGKYTLLGAGASLLIAILLMRRIASILVVLVASMAAAFWTLGALGLAGEKINVLTTVLPMLVMIVAFTDSVHLTFDIREARWRGESPRNATHSAIRHLTLACFLTSLTTAIGFGSLAISETEIIRRFGLACSAGATITFLAVMLTLPLLSSSRIGHGILPPRRTLGVEQMIRRWSSQMVDVLIRFRWVITICGFAAALAMLPAILQLEPENEIAENMPPESRSGLALQKVDELFGGILPVFITIDWTGDIEENSLVLYQALDRIHQLCEDNPHVTAPLSLLNLKEAVPARAPWALPGSEMLVSLEAHRTLVMCRSQDIGSNALSQSYDNLEQELNSLDSTYPELTFGLTGSSVIATRTIDRMISDLLASLGLATLVIFVTMAVVYRSWIIGLLCLLPNALPLMLTATALSLIDGNLRFASVIVFSVCLGISVDDTIHLVSRFLREFKRVGTVPEAIRESVRSVGTALMTTTLVLLVGLGIPLTSKVPGNFMFSWLSCIAIASALVADLILLPAMILCFLSDRRVSRIIGRGERQEPS